MARPVEHLVWRFAGGPPADAPPAGVDVRPWRDDDASALARLAVAAADRWPRPPGPSAAGWLAELRGRPGRDVQAWLAWETVVAGGVAAPLGFVTLVATSSAVGIRHAIGWLVVDPAARRRGIARALVAAALGAARRGGAETVWVETAAAWPEAAAFWRAVGFTAGRSPDVL